MTTPPDFDAQRRALYAQLQALEASTLTHDQYHQAATAIVAGLADIKRAEEADAATRGDKLAPLLDVAWLAVKAKHELRATWVPRPYQHPEREDVATHSLMLALVAGEIAAAVNRKQRPNDWVFNLPRVFTLAAVHDLLEVAPDGPGDLNTFVADDAAKQAHREAEQRALDRMSRERPWLAGWLREFAAETTREAVLVRCCDALVPYLTLAMTGCHQFQGDPDWPAKFEAFVARKTAELAQDCPSVWPMVKPYFDQARVAVLKHAPPPSAPTSIRFLEPETP